MCVIHWGTSLQTTMSPAFSVSVFLKLFILIGRHIGALFH